MKKIKYLLVVLLLPFFFVSCEKTELNDVNVTSKENIIKGQEVISNQTDNNWAYMQEQAQLRMNYIMSENKTIDAENLYKEEGTDPSIDLKARVSYYPSAGVKWAVFDLSIQTDTSVAQINSFYYTIHFTGNLQPAQGSGFNHNLWPPSAINWGSGVLLENAVGQTAYGAWYSITPVMVPSSTGQLYVFKQPVVAWIAFTGDNGTVTIDANPNATGISKDGNNNYIMSTEGFTL